MEIELTTLTITGLEVWCSSSSAHLSCLPSVSGCQTFIKSCSIESRNDPSTKLEMMHGTKFSLKISYSTHVWAPELDKHQTSKSYWRQLKHFKNSSMSILYKYTRNVRFVLFANTSNVGHLSGLPWLNNYKTLLFTGISLHHWKIVKFTRNWLWIFNGVFHKITELTILASHALLCEYKKKIQQQKFTPVRIEPGTSRHALLGRSTIFILPCSIYAN